MPVEGVVTLDGKPLASATVTLRRTDGAASEGIYLAETDAEGKYRLAHVHGGSPGAPSGNYSVFIKSVKPPPGANETIKLPPERVPGKWRDGSQTIDIPPGGTTEANFAITTR